MIKRAVDKENPTLIKSLPKNREKLDEAFQEVFIDFKAFKKDMGETDLNAKYDNGSYMHEYNDQWFNVLRENYYGLVEASDVVLETMAKSDVQKLDESKIATEQNINIKSKQDGRLVEQLIKQIECFESSTNASLEKISSEIVLMTDGAENPSKIDAFKRDLIKIEEKLDLRFCDMFNQLICLLSDAEVKDKESVKANFINTVRAKIDSLQMMLNKKISTHTPRKSVG